VVVEAGAAIRDSVVWPDTVVAAGATVDWSIVDERCHIGDGAVVGEKADDLDADALCLLGRDTRVAEGARVAAGARLEPGTTA
jgi:glucose-1-phosphate adenylyltransferase